MKDLRNPYRDPVGLSDELRPGEERILQRLHDGDELHEVAGRVDAGTGLGRDWAVWWKWAEDGKVEEFTFLILLMARGAIVPRIGLKDNPSILALTPAGHRQVARIRRRR